MKLPFTVITWNQTFGFYVSTFYISLCQKCFEKVHIFFYFTNCIFTFSLEQQALNVVGLMCCPYLLYIFLPVTRASRQKESAPLHSPCTPKPLRPGVQTPSYDLAYMWDLKRRDIDELTKQRETHSQKVNSWLPGRKGYLRTLGRSCTHWYI